MKAVDALEEMSCLLQDLGLPPPQNAFRSLPCSTGIR